MLYASCTYEQLCTSTLQRVANNYRKSSDAFARSRRRKKQNQWKNVPLATLFFSLSLSLLSYYPLIHIQIRTFFSRLQILLNFFVFVPWGDRFHRQSQTEDHKFANRCTVVVLVSRDCYTEVYKTTASSNLTDTQAHEL